MVIRETYADGLDYRCIKLTSKNEIVTKRCELSPEAIERLQDPSMCMVRNSFSINDDYFDEDKFCPRKEVNIFQEWNDAYQRLNRGPEYDEFVVTTIYRLREDKE